jgi:hypothetical protein
MEQPSHHFFSSQLLYPKEGDEKQKRRRHTPARQPPPSSLSSASSSSSSFQQGPIQQQPLQQQPQRQHGFCKNYLDPKHVGSTARQLWQQYLDPILYEASIHPDDKAQRIHGRWTRKLLNLLSHPHNQRLDHGIRTIPHHTKSLERIYDKLQQRLEYIVLEQQQQQQQQPQSSAERRNTPPPPLKILVFGGSVVEGIGCDDWAGKELKVRKNDTSRMAVAKTLRTCAWPFRLESFLNQIVHQLLVVGSSAKIDYNEEEPSLLPPLVEVHNLAVGGTNSDAALPVLQYWLSDVFEPEGADIVINAYSANDNLPPAFHASDNTTVDPFHALRIWKRNQDFISNALSYAQSSTTTSTTTTLCGDGTVVPDPTTTFPIVFYVDDYLGNQQQSIAGEGQLQEMITLLLREYQYLGLVGYVSAANMVRPYVIANTNETVFSPKWLDKKGKYAINVHFGLSMHVSIAWVIAYAFLQTTLDFCEDDRLRRRQRQLHYQEHRRPGVSVGGGASDTTTPTKDSATTKCEPVVGGKVGKEITAGTMPSLQFPPPGMSWSYLSTISKLWKETSTTASLLQHTQQHGSTTTCSDSSPVSSSSSHHPCVFAFLAAPLGTHYQEDRLHLFLQQFVIAPPAGLNPTGWRPKDNFRHGGFQNKLGLVATQPHATVTFGMQHISQPVRVLTLYYLKSYGPSWDNAKAQFTLDVFYNRTRTYTKKFVLEGFHNSNTSISYGFRLDLAEDKQGHFFATKKGAVASAGTMDKDSSSPPPPPPPPPVASASSSHRLKNDPQDQDHNRHHHPSAHQDIAPIGSSIRFRLDLISGTNFKINAMMFCSR